jgi:hypothetical protein
MSAPITVGKFTWDNGIVSGPETYMREQGLAWLAEIKAGRFPMVVKEGYRQNGGNVELAILVGIQTDYAGWIGYRSMFGAK